MADVANGTPSAIVDYGNVDETHEKKKKEDVLTKVKILYIPNKALPTAHGVDAEPK